MAASLLAVVVDCADPRQLAGFWAEALSYVVVERNPDEFQVKDPKGRGGTLYLMKVPEPKVAKNRLHLDLITQGSMEAEVARLTELGARVIEVRHDDPQEFQHPDTWTVLQDPEGNEFCVSSIATVTGWS
jgi:hypothetical protein